MPSSSGFLGTQIPHPLLLNSEEPMGHHADTRVRRSGCTCPGVASYPSLAGLSQCRLYLGPDGTVGAVPGPVHQPRSWGKVLRGLQRLGVGGLLISSPVVGLSPTPSPAPTLYSRVLSEVTPKSWSQQLILKPHKLGPTTSPYRYGLLFSGS